MAEVIQEQDRKRSPNYPSIALQLAVAKISKLYPKIGVNGGTKEAWLRYGKRLRKSKVRFCKPLDRSGNTG